MAAAAARAVTSFEASRNQNTLAAFRYQNNHKDGAGD